MTSTKEIIEINITRETQGVSRQGFGTPLFVGTTAEGWTAGERVRTYTSTDAALEDFAADSAEYKAVSNFFSQQVRPTYVKVGRHILGVPSVDVAVQTVVDATEYSVTVSDVVASYTSGTEATEQSIIDGLRNAFDGSGLAGAFEDNGDGTFTVYPDDTESANIQVSANLTMTENSENLTDALTAIREVDADWYFVTAATHDVGSILEIAQYVQTQTALYVTSYDGADAYSANATSDPGTQLQEFGYDRTAIIYTDDASDYPECAIIGLQAPKDPGSTTWKFKTVAGVAPSKLSTTQSIVLKGTKYDYGKGYNTYESVGGRSIFAEGRTASGEFIDVIRFSDWIDSRMRERIYMTLANSEKISLTPSGFAIIEGRMREVLNEGVTVGGLYSYSVSVPNPRNTDPNSRANRVATGFKFKGVLAGAVHAVEISGSLEI